MWESIIERTMWNTGNESANQKSKMMWPGKETITIATIGERFYLSHWVWSQCAESQWLGDVLISNFWCFCLATHVYKRTVFPMACLRQNCWLCWGNGLVYQIWREIVTLTSCTHFHTCAEKVPCPLPAQRPWLSWYFNSSLESWNPNTCQSNLKEMIGEKS